MPGRDGSLRLKRPGTAHPAVPGSCVAAYYLVERIVRLGIYQVHELALDGLSQGLGEPFDTIQVSCIASARGKSSASYSAPGHAFVLAEASVCARPLLEIEDRNVMMIARYAHGHRPQL
jgi:hypothetical protein